MISIILPVFNTEKYLEKCLDSILEQSYKDFEILAINDGSIDSSIDILRKYEKKDCRIRIIDKRNEGQGVARNIAIEQALGDIIFCIDSDDWITKDSLSIMVSRMISTNADIVIGNSACTFLDSEEIRIKNSEKVSGLIEGEQIKANVFNISATVWPKLIRKDLLTQNGIKFPSCYFEDLAVMPLVYALAERIAFVNKCIYIQRLNSSSTVHRLESIDDRIGFVDYLIDGFKAKNLYDKYELELRDYLVKRAQINLRMVKTLTNKIYMDFSTQQQLVWKGKFGLDTLINKNAVCFGSYNLMIITKIFMRLEDSASVPEYYGGSSLISCMGVENSCLNQLFVANENSFRRNMLIKDFERRFMNMNPTNFYDFDYFFIDFLEERFDIGVYSGEYFTISQAFMDIDEELSIHFERIKAFSDLWWKLWTDACDRFIDKLKIFAEHKKIILIKTCLSEKFFDDEREELFQEIDDIRRINVELDKCYLYFQEHCPAALVIDICGEEEYKTDLNFRHGCYPWHLSDFAYGKLSSKIEDVLNDSQTAKETK